MREEALEDENSVKDGSFFKQTKNSLNIRTELDESVQESNTARANDLSKSHQPVYKYNPTV
jgi:hypothetical protein